MKKIFAAIAALVIAAAAACGTTKTKTVYTTAPITAGSFTATVEVTDYSDPNNPQTFTLTDTPFWIMQQGDGISYWGALGQAGETKVIIDSKVENLPEPYIPGLYYDYYYTGTATETTANITINTYYMAADGSKIAGPQRTDFKFTNLTGPITLPVASPTPTPAAFAASEAPQMPVKDLTPLGLRAMSMAHAPHQE